MAMSSRQRALFSLLGLTALVGVAVLADRWGTETTGQAVGVVEEAEVELISGPTASFAGYEFYYGDLHAHTGASGDGTSSDVGTGCKPNQDCQPIGDAVDVAIENGLNFVAFSDHSNSSQISDEDLFNQVQQAGMAASNPANRFIVIPSAEVHFTVEDGPLGHRNLFLFGEDEEVASYTMTDAQPTGDQGIVVDDCDAIWTWMDDLRSRFGPVVLIPHHTAGSQPMPTDWSCHHERYEPAVEVYSGHGNSMIESTTYDPMWSEVEPTGTVHAALDPTQYGLKLAFVGGTDEHDTRPGEMCRNSGTGAGK